MGAEMKDAIRYVPCVIACAVCAYFAVSVHPGWLFGMFACFVAFQP